MIKNSKKNSSNGSALQEETMFTKTQIIQSKKFKHVRDSLNVLLDSNTKYTIKEVSQMLEDFMKGKVN